MRRQRKSPVVVTTLGVLFGALLSIAAIRDLVPPAFAQVAIEDPLEPYRILRVTGAGVTMQSFADGVAAPWLKHAAGSWPSIRADAQGRYLALGRVPNFIFDLRNAETVFHSSLYFYPGAIRFSPDSPHALWDKSVDGVLLIDLEDPSVRPRPAWDFLPDSAVDAEYGRTVVGPELGANGTLLLAGQSFDADGQPRFPLWGFDIRTSTVVFHGDVPFRPDRILVDEREEVILIIGRRQLAHFDAATGELLRLQDTPDSFHNSYDNRSLTLAAGRIVSFDDGTLTTYDRDSGVPLDSLAVGPGLYIGAVHVLDESGIVFLFVSDFAYRNRQSSIVAVDLEDMTILREVDVGTAEEREVAVIRVGPDGSLPPSPVLPTPTSTPTRVATPTPTACDDSCVRVWVEPVRASAGEKFDLNFHVEVGSKPLKGVFVNLSAEGALGLHFVGGRMTVCSVVTPTAVEMSHRMSSYCPEGSSRCELGYFAIAGQTAMNSTTADLPARVTVRCRLIIGAQAPPGAYRVGVEARSRTDGDIYFLGFFGAIVTEGDLVVSKSMTEATATPSATPVATATIMRAPTPAPGAPHIAIQTSHAVPGGIAVIEARLRTAGVVIGGVQLDLALPEGVVATDPDAWRCRGNPFLPHTAGFHPHRCDTHGCLSVRALLYTLALDQAAIPDDALLFTCRVALAPSAPLGSAALEIGNVVASTPAGASIAIAVETAAVRIR